MPIANSLWQDQSSKFARSLSNLISGVEESYMSASMVDPTTIKARIDGFAGPENLPSPSLSVHSKFAVVLDQTGGVYMSKSGNSV